MGIPTNDPNIASRLEKKFPNAKWEYHPPKYHRTGINSMFNHGPENWLVLYPDNLGGLRLVLARIEIKDAANMHV